MMQNAESHHEESHSTTCWVKARENTLGGGPPRSHMDCSSTTITAALPPTPTCCPCMQSPNTILLFFAMTLLIALAFPTSRQWRCSKPIASCRTRLTALFCLWLLSVWPHNHVHLQCRNEFQESSDSHSLRLFAQNLTMLYSIQKGLCVRVCSKAGGTNDNDELSVQTETSASTTQPGAHGGLVKRHHCLPQVPQGNLSLPDTELEP